MNESFDREKAKKHLSEQVELEKESNEKERQALLEKTIFVLNEKLSGKGLEIYLVGSITKPYAFTQLSDIDIVLKGFRGDRFELWTQLEELIGRNIELILYESCSFKEDLDSLGLKVI